MNADLDAALSPLLGQGGPVSEEQTEEAFADVFDAMPDRIETSFGAAGFYGRDGQPYRPPSTPWFAPRPANAPVISAKRSLWFVRFNPKPSAGEDPDQADVFDVDEPLHFDWFHPEGAEDWGWRIDTDYSKAGPALAALCSGDLVIVQRTDPGAGRRKNNDKHGTNVLLGLAAVLHVRAYQDIFGDLRRSACLLPLVRFDHPVPRRTANRRGRLLGQSFSAPRQRPGREGGVSHHLSPVEDDDIVDVLSVCGIHPEVLAEPSLAVIAARLGNSATGNKEFRDLRYDHVVANDARRAQEREAVVRAREWAEGKGHSYLDTAESEALAGYDLLFADSVGGRLQIEVKGYSSRTLRSVHLQPSQYLRAEAAARGVPPNWVLFALLGVGTSRPATERVLLAREAVTAIEAGGLRVKGGTAAVSKLRGQSGS